jgi:hypothetical protein
MSSDPLSNMNHVYNVIFIDAKGTETQLAERLADRDAAAQIARRTAAERGAGRMVLPGSAKLPNCVCVVPVEDLPSAA